MQFVSPGSPQRPERSSEPIGRRASLPTAVFLVLLLSSPAIAQTFPSIFFSLDSSGRTILIDQTQEGALTTHDPNTEDGRPIQVWQLDTRVGRPLQVTVESPDFDTLLTVVGPGIDQPLHNDDRPDDTNSTICFVPSMDGEYRAVVSSYEPRSVGSFLLSSTSRRRRVRASGVHLSNWPLTFSIVVRRQRSCANYPRIIRKYPLTSLSK